MIKNLRKKGFVLTGFMIIIGIIALVVILAAILIPVLSKSSSTRKQDNLDIAAAQAAIEEKNYFTNQIDALDSEAAFIKAQALVNELGVKLKETTVSVIGGAFNSAIAGNADDSDGTNGSYTFTVKISKGKGTEIISAEKTMMIIATPYVSQLVPITAFSNIIGTAKVGDELKAGNLTPSSATVNYQWKISDTLDGSYTNIVGATKSKYTIIVANTGKFIKVEALEQVFIQIQ